MATNNYVMAVVMAVRTVPVGLGERLGERESAETKSQRGVGMEEGWSHCVSLLCGILDLIYVSIAGPMRL